MTAQPFETGRCFLKRVVLPALVLAAHELGVERLCSAEIDDPSQAFRVSLSISPFSGFMLAQGVTFVDGKVAATTLEELQQLYVAYGATELYARINTRRVHPGGPADHSLERGLEKARLAKRLGIPFNPELGLFRTYGDIRCQTPPDFSDYSEIDAPSPWMSLSMDQMTPLLRKYGAVVATEILDTGVKVNIWNLGNEVEFGAAGVAVAPVPGADACAEEEGPEWYRSPDAIDTAIGEQNVASIMRMAGPEKIRWLQVHLWPHLARILAAVADGIRSVDSEARFSTHGSGYLSVRPALALAFYQALKDGGFFPDELGFSFYPTSSAGPGDRLAHFVETVRRTRGAFERPIMIAEFAYPAGELTEGPFRNWNHALTGYPLTSDGQADMVRDLASWGVTAGVSGIRPWAPDLVVPGWSPMALFEMRENSAVARSSVAAIADGARNPDPHALEGLD